MTEHSIPDVQDSPDCRGIAINRVGVCDIRVPMTINNVVGETQHTVGKAEMTVSLPYDKKGTHMSRFIQILNETQQYELATFTALHQCMLTCLNAQEGTLAVNFPYFVEKKAPITGTPSLMDYETAWIVDGGADDSELQIEVTVPVTSLCPCSKEMSKYGAHNQRSHIIITVLYDPEKPISMEELIAIGEKGGSCPIWATLKRPDEKYVTEHAYENPKFVEDIVRDVATLLNEDDRIQYYSVSSENFESIHNHNAYAVIEHDKRYA